MKRRRKRKASNNTIELKFNKHGGLDEPYPEGEPPKGWRPVEIGNGFTIQKVLAREITVVGMVPVIIGISDNADGVFDHYVAYVVEHTVLILTTTRQVTELRKFSQVELELYLEIERSHGAPKELSLIHI